MVYEFRWNSFNLEKISRHGLSVEEVEFVANNARRPYPKPRGDDAWFVVGFTRAGTAIQVFYAVDDDGETLFVFHARPRTRHERNRDSQERRR